MNSDINNYFENIATEFDKKYDEGIVFKKRIQTWYDAMKNSFVDGGLCLDVGCGSGVLARLAAINHMRVICIDPSYNMLQLAKNNLEPYSDRVTFEQDALPFSSFNYLMQKASVLICSSVLEYVDNIELATNQLFECTASNGKVFVSLPNQKSIMRGLEKSFYKVSGRAKTSYLRYQKHQFSKKSASELFEKVGFQIIDHRFFGTISLLGKLGISDQAERIGTLMLFTLKKP